LHLLTYVQDRPGRDLRYAIDVSKVQQEAGRRPRHSFEAGLRKTVQWYLDNSPWWRDTRSGAYRGERLGVAV
jgi:dTDP-glucose 4,6-dehydratase